VQTFFRFIAEEVREHHGGARLPHDGRNDRAGRVPRRDTGAGSLEGAGLDLSPLLHLPECWRRVKRRRRTTAQDPGLDGVLDHTLIAQAAGARARRTGVDDAAIRNVHRTAGTLLGYEITRRYGGAGLPDDTIRVNFADRPGRASAPSAARPHALAGGRRQRLRRQGTLRRRG
jgi:glutamate synthase (NADPH) large chain